MIPSLTCLPPTLSTPLQAILSLRTHLSKTLFSAEAYYHLIEALFLILILYLALTRAYKPLTRPPTLTPAQIASKIAAWKPAPLAAPLSPSLIASLPLDLTLSTPPTPSLIVNDRPALNLATTNFLGLLKHPRVEDAARRAMRHYGCGACGPRGFYGTTHLHLQCEDHLAQFCNTKSAILYSFGPATANSTIPAFCKRGDLVVVDEAVNFSIMSGVRLSRAQVITFRHNDISHLHEVLKQVVAEDVKHPNIANTQRRIIIVEGLYLTTGNIAPLPEIVALKDRYLFRLMLDDSLSLGVLGNSGRGALQHFNLPPSCVDIKTADLGNAIASVGGFCVGNEDVVDHQRLSGAGYCFSASQPPFLAAAVIAALHIIVEEGNSLVADLRRNVALFRTAMNLERIPWIMEGHALSPLIHIRCLRHDVAPHVFTDIQKLCLDAGVLVNRPVYAVSDTNAPKPSIRITISAAHTPEMIETAANVIREALVTASQP